MRRNLQAVRASDLENSLTDRFWFTARLQHSHGVIPLCEATAQDAGNLLRLVRAFNYEAAADLLARVLEGRSGN